MISSTPPIKSRYKLVLAFSALFLIAFFTSCQLPLNEKLEEPSIHALSPTASISATFPIRPTFTHLPGDVYFRYQTQTAAPSAYATIQWETPNLRTTVTPRYGLTETVIALTAYTCLLAYPDFCISPNHRQSCDELTKFEKLYFTVYTPDPYNYDKDRNGLGCDTEE